MPILLIVISADARLLQYVGAREAPVSCYTSEDMYFQDVILTLQRFWAEPAASSCSRTTEVGAGTYNPATFLRALGPEPWNAAFVEPSRRPADGLTARTPTAPSNSTSFQVILTPSPIEHPGPLPVSRCARSAPIPGPRSSFLEDDWESPTLGAWGLGWQVWLDGQEISQFTYFQQIGGIDCRPVSGELTYGVERIAMYLQDVESMFDLAYGKGVTYGEIYKRAEWEWSTYNFEKADTAAHFEAFTPTREVKRLLSPASPKDKLVLPAYASSQSRASVQRARRARRHRFTARHVLGAYARWPVPWQNVTRAARGARLLCQRRGAARS